MRRRAAEEIARARAVLGECLDACLPAACAFSEPHAEDSRVGRAKAPGLLWYVICAAQKGRSRGPGRRISNAPTAGCYERLLRRNAIGMPYSRHLSEKDILQVSCDRGRRGGT